MQNDYVVCTRKVKGSKFVSEPGDALFLSVPAGEAHKPAHAIDKKKWVLQVQAAAASPADGAGRLQGNVLVVVHGYNNSVKEVIDAHRRLRGKLAKADFDGVVVSFDWPSASSAINYLEDRKDARTTAGLLVTECITVLADRQQNGCAANVHVLAHSTGAFVVREAFDYADDNATMRAVGWTISQLLFISGDISSASMSAGNSTTDSLIRHCVRMTNYSNPFDAVLSISNMKRAGAAPRVGRVGLPNDAPQKCVNVDCGEHYRRKYHADENILHTHSHSWYIGDDLFVDDLIFTLRGEIDRSYIPTRASVNGKLILREIT